MGFADKMKKMTKAAKEQMEDYNPAAFGSVPTGTYSARVKVVGTETKTNPRAMAAWTFVVADDGAYQGRQLFDNTVLEDNKVGLQICRQRVEALGYTWPEDNLGELESILESITERCPLITINVKSSEESTKVYFKSVIEVYGDDSGEATSPAEETTPSDETPTAEEVTPGDENIVKLIEICERFDISGITTDVTVEDAIEALSGSDVAFEEGDLTEEDKEFLASIDAEKLIKKAKKAVTIGKKTTPAPAAPAKKGAPIPAPKKKK